MVFDKDREKNRFLFLKVFSRENNLNINLKEEKKTCIHL